MPIQGFGAIARCAFALMAVVVTPLIPAPRAHADLIQITASLPDRTAGLGSFNGTIEYSYDAFDAKGTLIVTLINTDPPENRGYITGFIFNINSDDPNAKARLIDGPPKFRSAVNQNGNPFGHPFDSGAALLGHFRGGGNPRKGIAVGDTGIFQFNVRADDAADFTASDFISGPFDKNFIVRFRGFRTGGTDLVPAQVQGVPGPSVLALLAVATLISRRRRRTH